MRLPFAVKVQNSGAVKVYDSKGEVCERGGSTKDKFLNLYGRRSKFVLCEVFLLYGRLWCMQLFIICLVELGKIHRGESTSYQATYNARLLCT